LFTACAASRLLTKSYPVTGITRENLRPEYPVSALRLGSYLPHSCLEAAFQRIYAAALSGKGICVLLFVIAFDFIKATVTIQNPIRKTASTRLS